MQKKKKYDKITYENKNEKTGPAQIYEKNTKKEPVPNYEKTEPTPILDPNFRRKNDSRSSNK